MLNIALPFQRKGNSECYNVVTYGQLSQQLRVTQLRKHWWRSSESIHFPPMWPWFDSLTRRHMKVEFVGSLLCSERFFPLLQNLHLIKFDLYTTPQDLSFKTYRIIIIIIIIISQSVYEDIGFSDVYDKELSLFQWDSDYVTYFSRGVALVFLAMSLGKVSFDFLCLLSFKLCAIC